MHERRYLFWELWTQHCWVFYFFPPLLIFSYSGNTAHLITFDGFLFWGEWKCYAATQYSSVIINVYNLGQCFSLHFKLKKGCLSEYFLLLKNINWRLMLKLLRFWGYTTVFFFVTKFYDCFLLISEREHRHREAATLDSLSQPLIA